MVIGFLGFGEAAYHMAKGLLLNGVEQIVAYDVMQETATSGTLIHRRALDSGVKLKATISEVTEKAKIIIAAVPSSATYSLFEQARPYLKRCQIYVDVSSSAPEIKAKIAQALQETDVLFVDAAMLGSLPKDAHRVPIVASGDGAEAFCAAMTPYGMHIHVIGERPGDASSVKLVRSIFMKGLAALMIEMLQAASAYQVSDEVIRSISTSMDNIPFTAHLDRLVVSTAIHAARRAKELEGSIEMLKHKSLDASMSIAAKKKHELLAKDTFAKSWTGEAPISWKDIILERGDISEHW